VVIESIAAGGAGFDALAAVAFAAWFAARLRVPGGPVEAVGGATLVLPATGRLDGFEDLLKALAAQTLPARRLIVTVESADDPAHARVTALAERHGGLRIEVVVAGLSARRGQKCTNILAALARLDAGDAYLVLLDADIRPQPWWLAAMVGPLAEGAADIVNGYRWPMPGRAAPAAALVASIDRGMAVLPRVERARTMWGGSIALTRRALAALDLPLTIGRTLTEDLPIGDRAAQAGLRVLIRRAIRAPTPLDGNLRELWRFGRRQYQLIRLYRPGLWSWAALSVTTDLLARLALIATAAAGGASGFARTALVGLAILGSIAVELRVGIGKRLGAPDRVATRLWQHLFAWAILPAPLFHASAIWGGLVTSPVRWAHIRYAVDRSGRVTAVSRRPFSEPRV
jgi:Glycosyl transferase family 21